MEKNLRQTPSDCIRVALVGPESTGKTTLAKALAIHYKTEWVPEFAREYLQQKWDTKKKICAQEDIFPIALGQMELENKYVLKANKLLFCDTTLLTTEVFSRVYFDNWCDKRIIEANKENHYSIYLLTNIDVPWVADDLRDKPNERHEMFLSFQKALETRKIKYVLLKGTHDTRMNTAIEYINSFL